ncbi:MAG: hypothetical protein Unbinned5213contig1001_27 [Prokaryotic dsDNA virus sp.]|nr:MAG: hypothetical protein Unbinned5213contig1001_27 [Prokaryotic dsDNA virus sp.]
MPIPKPKANETNKEFIDRCMTDEVMTSEYKNEKQRLAICSSRLKLKPLKDKI